MQEKPRWWTIQAPLRALCFVTPVRTAGKLPTRQGISNQSYILWSVSNAVSHPGTSFSTWWVDVLFPSPFHKQLSSSESSKTQCLTTFIYNHPHLLSLSPTLSALPGSHLSHVSECFLIHESTMIRNWAESEDSHPMESCQTKVQMPRVWFQQDSIFVLGLSCASY